MVEGGCHDLAVSGTGFLNFTDDSSMMTVAEWIWKYQENSRKFHQIIGKYFILHQNNDQNTMPVQSRNYKGKEMESQSPDLNPIEHEISPAEEERKEAETPQNKQQLVLASLKAGKSISKDEIKSLGMSTCHRLTAVIVCNGSATK